MKTNVRKLIATVLVMLAVACFGTLGAFAAGEDDTAAVAETTAVTETDETSAHNASLSIGLIAAALATGLAGIGGGIAVAAGAPGRHRRQQRKPQDLRQEPDLRRSGRIHRPVRPGHLHHDPVEAGVNPCAFI